MMKALFLDIDGVLSGIDYQESAVEEPPLIDKSRLPILKEIVDKSGVQVVLSSSWKKAWEKGCAFDCVFQEAGIEIQDTTPVLGRKREEITAWLKLHPEVDGFVILDDDQGGWGLLEPYVVNTDPLNARGLESEHIATALDILDKKRETV